MDEERAQGCLTAIFQGKFLEYATRLFVFITHCTQVDHSSLHSLLRDSLCSRWPCAQQMILIVNTHMVFITCEALLWCNKKPNGLLGQQST